MSAEVDTLVTTRLRLPRPASPGPEPQSEVWGGWAVHGAGAGRAEPASSPRGSRGLRRARFQKEPSRRVSPSR